MEKVIPNFENYTINTKGEVLNTSRNKYKKPQCYKNGYLFVSLYNDGQNKMFLIHRLVAEAFIPNPENKPQVGHWDCDRTNNCVENLYWCTADENMANPITRENISKSKKGKHPSETTKNKMSEAASKRIGVLNSFYHKRHSDEFKKKASKRMKEKLKNEEFQNILSEYRKIAYEKMFKACDQINPITGEIIKIWNNYDEFAASKYNRKCVRRCCQGERKTYKGFVWKYHSTQEDLASPS